MTCKELMGLNLVGKTIQVRGNIIGKVTECFTKLDKHSGMDGVKSKAWIHFRLGNEPVRSYTNEQFSYEEIANGTN